jgi:hypothetical protein
MHNLLLKKLLFGQKKVEKVSKSGKIFFSKDYCLEKIEWKGQTIMCESLYKCISSPLKVEDSYQNLIHI